MRRFTLAIALFGLLMTRPAGALRRVTGGKDIPAWVAAGAPIAVADDARPR